jgi:hypothetical protein
MAVISIKFGQATVLPAASKIVASGFPRPVPERIGHPKLRETHASRNLVDVDQSRPFS